MKHSEKSASGDLKLVECKEQYWEFIRWLRTDERTQQGFVEQVEIIPEQQVAYMSNHSQEYRVCLKDGMPVGFVGDVDGDIRVATHPDYRGLGIGLFMIQEQWKVNPGGHAKIKLDNTASIKLFEKAGFKKKFYILEKET